MSIAIGVALMQAYIQRQQQKQNLFDKRFELYSAVSHFLSAVIKTEGIVFETTYETFVFETKPVKFLFGLDVTRFVSEIKSAISHETHQVMGTYEYVAICRAK